VLGITTETVETVIAAGIARKHARNRTHAAILAARDGEL
jgi:hypothetical protein